MECDDFGLQENEATAVLDFLVCTVKNLEPRLDIFKTESPIFPFVTKVLKAAASSSDQISHVLDDWLLNSKVLSVLNCRQCSGKAFSELKVRHRRTVCDDNSNSYKHTSCTTRSVL